MTNMISETNETYAIAATANDVLYDDGAWDAAQADGIAPMIVSNRAQLLSAEIANLEQQAADICNRLMAIDEGFERIHHMVGGLEYRSDLLGDGPLDDTYEPLIVHETVEHGASAIIAELRQRIAELSRLS